jgi:hypothetical protein
MKTGGNQVAIIRGALEPQVRKPMLVGSDRSTAARVSINTP